MLLPSLRSTSNRPGCVDEDATPEVTTMAARRSLGGGRVLGSGKNLAPPPPPKSSKSTARAGPGLLSPSESSVSLSSQTSSTPYSTVNEDLTSRVALREHGSAQAAAAARSRMVCPICSEEMTTLLQLNRHIDDNHANLEEVEQEEAKTWFEQQMKKAKKFQPLQLLNQKLRGLESFESNNDATLLVQQAAPQSSGKAPVPTPAAPPTVTSPDPNDIITRAHWQRPTGADACADPMCGKRLGAANGQINCRHCGKLFCEEHTMYQMRLSRSAKHEPVRGFWYRVCETCYKSRDGYNDHTGFERDHATHFKAVRRKDVDKRYLETSRLETRLTRLTQLLANPPPPDPKQRTIWSSISGDKDHIRALEQSIVPWEEDNFVAECPFCQQPFTQYTLRRHHCRMCGRVVCGDPATSCSSEIGLDVNKVIEPSSEKGMQTVGVDVRMCKDCQRTLFSKADFARDLSTEPADQRSFRNLVQFERGIRSLLPKFQRLLLTLQDPESPPPQAPIAEASKVRKRLTDAFTQYDAAARRIRDMPTDSLTQARLQKAIHQQATNFLHVHMLPLKSIPKIMKHATPNGGPPPLSAPTNGRPQNALSSIQYNRISNGEGSRPGSAGRTSSSTTTTTSSAVVNALEAEETALRERLIVLEEQKFMVSDMIADANKRRRFDEVGSLSQNVEDLSREIDQIQGQLAQMDFAGAYAAAATDDADVIK